DEREESLPTKEHKNRFWEDLLREIEEFKKENPSEEPPDLYQIDPELGKRIQCNVELKKCEGSVQAHYEKICI
uniref:Uncharacterized protein n=1 Tax=Romanomermis culicivorax TaxID=13658 RepID=A0A915IFK3_ROMCU